MISVETNYQPAYYLSDIFLLVSFMVILLFLKIKVEKNKGSILHAFKSLVNPATGVYFTIMLGLGIGLGIFNYVPLYLQDEMEASSAMIGEYLLTAYYVFYEI